MYDFKTYLTFRGGNASPLLTPPVKRSATPTKRYWDAHEETDDEIDIETVDPDPGESIPYDPSKARNLMQQCEKHSKIIKGGEDDDNWENQIVK